MFPYKQEDQLAGCLEIYNHKTELNSANNVPSCFFCMELSESIRKN